MGSVQFTNARQAVGFFFMLAGGLGAMLLLSLPILLSLEAWPPWRDLTLDEEGVRATAVTTGSKRAISGKSKGRGDTSWVLEVRIEDGAHQGKTTRVYCTMEWGCPLIAGAKLDVEVSPSDVSIARMRGHRSAVMPLWVSGSLFGLGLVSALVTLVGLGLYATGGRQARTLPR